MKHHLPFLGKLSILTLGCFLFFNSAGGQNVTIANTAFVTNTVTYRAEQPCTVTNTDTSTSINCGSSVTVGTNLYNRSGTYNDTLTGYQGCDSIITLHLTVRPDTVSQFGGLCAGDSIYFYGRWIHTPGSYDTLLAGNPCDTFASLSLVVQDPLPPHNLTATICSNDSLLFAGVYLHASGTYSHIHCDSSAILNLTVLQVATSTVTQTICWDQHYYGHDTSGLYIDTFTVHNGCDSIRTLNLTVIPVEIAYDTQTICQGQSYSGHSATGNYTDTITSINSCDKIRNLSLTVLPAGASRVTKSVCHGQSYGGHSATGTYIDTLTGLHGCDSLVTLQLTVLPVAQTNFTESICAGASYNFRDSVLTITGIYTDTIVAANGCDSIVTLNLTVLPRPLSPYITQQGDTLVSSSAPGYQWYINDTAIAGDTGMIVIAGQYGSYQVEITGPNGCRNISGAYHYQPTDISSVSAGFDVKLYPNPNNGTFIVEFTGNSLKEVSVTDVLGQVIVPSKKVAMKEEFDLNALAGGIYWLKIKDLQNSSRVVFKQIVIQH